jgi:hypothetical protein
MDPVLFAVDTHAQAILFWTKVSLPGKQLVDTAGRVSQARRASEYAVNEHKRVNTNWYAETDTTVQALILIGAACRDAEVKAAIDAHSDAIKLLVK